MKQAGLLGIVLLVLAPSSVLAWGQDGHRIVAAIAQRHLTAEPSVPIGKLLDARDLAQVSTWPDEIRSDPAWDCANPFHFVTVPPGKHYPEGAGSGGDLPRAIVYYVGVLTDPGADREAQVRALKFVVHFVGDIHQPLHVGLGCDRGGNEIGVDWFGEKTNLHSVWDERLIESTNLSYTEFAAFVDHVTKEQIRDYQRTSLLDWVREAQEQLSSAYTCYEQDHCPCYCGDCSGGTSAFGGCTTRDCALKVAGEVRLAYQYKHHAMPAIETQLRKGGIRLAGMLNWIFSKKRPPPPAFQKMSKQIQSLPDWDAPMRACARRR